MTTLQEFCALPSNGSYIVYDDINHTFGRCFLWTGISYICYLIYAIQCAYLLGVSKSFSSKRTSFITVCACTVSLLIAFSSLIEVILCYALQERNEHPPAYVLAKGISFTAWMLCFLLHYKVTSITREKKQNNKYQLLPLLLVILSTSMQLQFVLAIPDYADFFHVHYVGHFVDFSLTILYLLISFVIGLSNVTSVQLYDTLEEEGSSDVQKEKEIHLGPSESSTNVISRLVYWWSDGLLKKGMKKQLKTPEDLFYLPESLNTIRMKEILTKELREEKEKLLKGMTTDEKFKHEVKKKSLKVSLFKVLNRCFGKGFYSLAILKLLTNGFQLVQPTLVNLLVTYVSDKTVCDLFYVFYRRDAFFLCSSNLSLQNIMELSMGQIYFYMGWYCIRKVRIFLNI